MKLTSLQNKRVKEIVKTRSRSKRDAGDCMLIEGLRPVEMALAADWRIDEIFCCPRLFRNGRAESILADARGRGIQIVECSEPVFRKIAYRTRPEGVIALGAGAGTELSDIELSKEPLLLIAEGVEKPGNLGALLRIADAVGVDALIVADGGTDLNNPNVVRASVGAVFSVCTAEATSAAILSWLKSNAIPIVATTPAARHLHTDADLSGSQAIVFGAEQPGLTNFWVDCADLLVRIPMLGRVDSLNVATSAAVMLYEANRQRQIRDK